MTGIVDFITEGLSPPRLGLVAFFLIIEAKKKKLPSDKNADIVLCHEV